MEGIDRERKRRTERGKYTVRRQKEQNGRIGTARQSWIKKDRAREIYRDRKLDSDRETESQILRYEKKV